MDLRSQHPPRQRIEEPTEAEAAGLQARRDWVRGHFTEESRWKYDDVEGKLYLLCGILAQSMYPASDQASWQTLGMALGDAFAQQLGMRWVMVEDELGRTPALQDPERPTTIVYPLSMISKRMEFGEPFDAVAAFERICGTVRELRADPTGT